VLVTVFQPDLQQTAQQDVLSSCGGRGGGGGEGGGGGGEERRGVKILFLFQEWKDSACV